MIYLALTRPDAVALLEHLQRRGPAHLLQQLRSGIVVGLVDRGEEAVLSMSYRGLTEHVFNEQAADDLWDLWKWAREERARQLNEAAPLFEGETS